MATDNTIWLTNSNDNHVGIISANAYTHNKLGYLSINCDPSSFSVSLTPGQMRALSAQLLAAADEVELGRINVKDELAKAFDKP